MGMTTEGFKRYVSYYKDCTRRSSYESLKIILEGSNMDYNEGLELIKETMDACLHE